MNLAEWVHAQGIHVTYARVSSYDQKADLGRQVARLSARNRALNASGWAQRGIGAQAALAARSVWCGGGG